MAMGSLMKSHLIVFLKVYQFYDLFKEQALVSLIFVYCFPVFDFIDLGFYLYYFPPFYFDFTLGVLFDFILLFVS